MVTKTIPGLWAGKQFNGSPKGVVVHAMAQVINGLSAPEFLKSIGLSVHACIEPDGTVALCAPETQTAYHAGKSRYKGYLGLNSYFLGVELLVEGEHDYSSFVKAITKGSPYTDKQYVALAELCRKWADQFAWDEPPIIVGHSDVSGSDVRPSDPKIDPGKAFVWSKFWNEFNKV